MTTMNQALGEASLREPVTGFIRRDFVTLRTSMTVGDALAALRTERIGEKIVYFYVLDTDDRLVGVVPTRRILMSPPEGSVEGIMVRGVVTLPESATVQDACEKFLQYRFLAFPVVDAERRIVGVVDIGLFTDEIADLAETRFTEDVFQVIGVHLSAIQHRSPWIGFLSRFPWLLCNIGAGLGCAFLANQYAELLDSAIVIALFIPIVLALAESVSIQSTTITLEQLRRGRITLRSLVRSLRREFISATLLGAACGGVVGTVAWVWKGEWQVAVALASSILLSMLTACLLGVALPTLVRAMRGDPKIAAGPIVLALADLATLLLYFSLSIRLVV